MSKLIDFFNRTAKSSIQPMGFHTSRNAAPKPLLGLIIAVTDPAPVAGADALLVRPVEGRLTAKIAKELTASLGDTPWGLATGTDKPAPAPSGCDFLVIPAAGRVDAASVDDDVATVLELDASMDDGLLRAAGDLPVEAVLLADVLEEDGPLTWHRLMILGHVTRLVQKPVIVTASAAISEADLKSLWNAGIDGILVEADETAAAGLRTAIDALPPRTTPKNHTEALLPRPGTTADTGAPAEPDEPDEDDDWE